MGWSDAFVDGLVWAVYRYSSIPAAGDRGVGLADMLSTTMMELAEKGGSSCELKVDVRDQTDWKNRTTVLRCGRRAIKLFLLRSMEFGDRYGVTGCLNYGAVEQGDEADEAR